MAFRTAEEAINPTPTQLVGRRKFVDVNNPAFRRGPLGQKLFERKKYETEQFNNIQKLAEERAMKAEAQKAKDAENRRRFDATQGAITKRAFRPYEVATQNAYDFRASTPTPKDFGMEGENFTIPQMKRLMIEKFPKANRESPQLKELMNKEPIDLSAKPQGNSWLKDLVSAGHAALGKIWGAGKSALGMGSSAHPEFPVSAAPDQGDPGEDAALAAMEQGQLSNSATGQNETPAQDETPQYGSEEEAGAAGHAPGTIVIINGRRARID